MTPHVLEQLPLWIEGDLSDQDWAGVESHLAQCPACRAAAEDLRASQAWLREAMASPFEAADTARLRRSVVDQIRLESARPLRPLVIRPALLAASAAALLLLSLIWRFDRGRSGGATRSLVPPAAAAASPSEPAGPSTPGGPETAPPRAQARAKPKDGTAAPPQSGPARIEFQTADPNVRIIWLAQATPRSEPSSTPEEKS
ncbi:MAG TPA: zf-HC2 domain-containing protein [Geothrix sp.]|nr:zf-HC2 domain-containing protein [Geothrix sp.]